MPLISPMIRETNLLLKNWKNWFYTAGLITCIVGVDTNAHHTTWYSSDINNRDECLFDFIISNDLELPNRCSKLTHCNKKKTEKMYWYYSSVSWDRFQVSNYYVSDEPSLSDNRIIFQEIKNNDELKIQE